MRRRTCLWFGGALGALFFGLVGFLLGDYVLPQTDMIKAFGTGAAAGAMLGWAGFIGGVFGGARLGASYYRSKRKAREALARRKHYAEQIAQHEQENASDDDEWEGQDRMPLRWKSDKSDDFESPWP